MTHYKHWSKGELQRLQTLYEQHRTNPDLWSIVGRELDRSSLGVQLKARALGLTFKPDGISEYDVEQVAMLLGRDPASVLEWIRRRKFGRTLRPHKKHSQYIIQPDDLWAWMEDIRSWHLWEPEALQDPAWREHFGELRAGWVPTKEAARLLDVSAARVTQLFRTGNLAGVKTSEQAIWFRRSEIAAYQMRSKTLEQQISDLVQRLGRLEAVLERLGIVPAEGCAGKGRRAGAVRGPLRAPLEGMEMN